MPGRGARGEGGAPGPEKVTPLPAGRSQPMVGAGDRTHSRKYLLNAYVPGRVLCPHKQESLSSQSLESGPGGIWKKMELGVTVTRSFSSWVTSVRCVTSPQEEATWLVSKRGRRQKSGSRFGVTFIHDALMWPVAGRQRYFFFLLLLLRTTHVTGQRVTMVSRCTEHRTETMRALLST